MIPGFQQKKFLRLPPISHSCIKSLEIHGPPLELLNTKKQFLWRRGSFFVSDFIHCALHLLLLLLRRSLTWRWNFNERERPFDRSIAYPTIWIKKVFEFRNETRFIFLKMAHSEQPFYLFIFIYFRLLKTVPNTVDSKKNLPTTGFEPRIFGVGNDHSTNWATTTANETTFLGCCRRIRGT